MTISTGLSTAKSGIDRQFVGKSYGPMTDKEQGDATAILNHTPVGLKGKLHVAGFNIPLGKSDRLSDETDHPEVETFSFVTDDDRFAVTEEDEKIPLRVRIDMLGSRVTGTITRPSPKYGSVAFSLNPTDEGFSHSDLRGVLHPERVSTQSVRPDEISIPSEGVPTDNSIRNAPAAENTSTAENSVGTSDYITPPGGGGDNDDDVGFLDADNTPTWGGERTHTFEDRCGEDSTSMSWTYEFGTSADVRYNTDGTIATDYDEIAALGGFKRYQMQAHFSEVPDRMLLPCDQDMEEGMPYQTNVEFWARQKGSTEQNEAALSEPQPDEKDNSPNPGDGILDLGLDIVNSVSGVYGSVASTVIKYALNDSSGSGIEVDHNRLGDQEEYHWMLPLDGGPEDDTEGNRYFPDHTENVAGASFHVENGLPPGYTAELETRSQFEFAYIDYLGGCPCPSFSTALKTTKTSVVSNSLTYTSVER
ncbi:hypothetical protein [Halorhabdus rudnickae]|uniref:hypothetical protein n=1 Tax=Halorhabdus rudnickae TaxID=1775544 RepID=UPI0010836369|nr:hypothetical protein [Halorhabdus rudnickae]